MRAGPISASMRGIEPPAHVHAELDFGDAEVGATFPAKAEVERNHQCDAAANAMALDPAAIVTWSMSCQALHILGPSLIGWRRMRSPIGKILRAPPTLGILEIEARGKSLYAEPVRITTDVSRSSSKVARHVARSSRIACWLKAH